MGENSFMDGSTLERDKAIIVLSFDDGRADQLLTAQYLQEQGVPAVFNITTGYLRGCCPTLAVVPPMDEEGVRWIADQSLFEIAAHGDLHDNSVQDITLGRNKLMELLQKDMSAEYVSEMNRDRDRSVFMGFASPGSKMTPEFVISHEEQLKKLGFSYVRTGSLTRTYRMFQMICRKMGRIAHFPSLYLMAHSESLVDSKEKFCFTSVPILADTTLREVEALVDLAVRKKKVCVLMFHSILDKKEAGYRDLWTWDRTLFEGLVRYLQERQNKGDLSIMNVRQYLNG